jgi:phosphatidylglycerol:prolipoprotein diacylglycerol transferase
MRPAIVKIFEELIGTGFFVPDYAFMQTVAILLGIFIAIKEAEKKGLDLKKVFYSSLIIIISAAVSSRIFVIIQNFENYSTDLLSIFYFWKGGTASTGAYIGGFIALILLTKFYKIPVKRFLDCIAIPVSAAIFFGRIGCFLNGCCYGKKSDLPWAMHFPDGSGPYYDQLQSGLITPNQLSLPVHPTQLYEALYALVLFFFLMLYKKYQKLDGELFAVLFIIYPLGRFLNEFLRADDRGSFLIFSSPQLLSIVAIIISVGFLYLKKMSVKKVTFDLSGG